MPGAASRRHRMRFEKRAEGPDDGYGNRDQAWTLQFQEMARVLPLKGSEPVIASRLAGVQPVIITIASSRAARLVGNDWRCVDANTGTIYNIRSGANFDERNREIDFTAETGVPV